VVPYDLNVKRQGTRPYMQFLKLQQMKRVFSLNEHINDYYVFYLFHKHISEIQKKCCF
jgi:hypothetical protein